MDYAPSPQFFLNEKEKKTFREKGRDVSSQWLTKTNGGRLENTIVIFDRVVPPYYLQVQSPCRSVGTSKPKVFHSKH